MKLVFTGDDGKIKRTPYLGYTEKEYIAICSKIWGVVPVDVLWATSSKLYVNELNNK